MESVEQMLQFTIQPPQLGDEVGLGQMHIQAWKETYVAQNPTLTNQMVEQMIGHFATDTSFRKNTIIQALEHPDTVLYRVVKNSSNEIVGFFHATKTATHNELEAIYLLDAAKNAGVGKRLMEEFLAWANKEKPSRLEVFSFNTRAIEFYNRYGFERTGEPEALYKDVLPYVYMEKPVENSD